MYRHHRVACIVYLLALGIIHMLYCEFHGRGIRREQLQLVSAVEFIPLAEHGVPVRVAGPDHGSDIRIRFDGYTVLKSGKVREKISISLLRDGVDCGSFGKFSAGEAARVNLATILAMQKLVNANCDDEKGLDLLVLDEILEAVDEAGLASMFEALNALGGTVLVVSHGNVAEGYPHKLVIVKENGESRIGE